MHRRMTSQQSVRDSVEGLENVPEITYDNLR